MKNNIIILNPGKNDIDDRFIINPFQSLSYLSFNLIMIDVIIFITMKREINDMITINRLFSVQ